MHRLCCNRNHAHPHSGMGRSGPSELWQGYGLISSAVLISREVLALLLRSLKHYCRIRWMLWLVKHVGERGLWEGLAWDLLAQLL